MKSCFFTDISVGHLESLVESLMSVGDVLKGPRRMVRAAKEAEEQLSGGSLLTRVLRGSGSGCTMWTGLAC